MPDAPSPFSAINLAARDRVVVAVSGGGDSLALLFLLSDYLKENHSASSLLAVTVDHGLRAESAAEARTVGALCARHGIEHRIVAWQGPKPETSISAAAREARFCLLSQAAIEAGTDLVLTGHTADDQAETVAMRLARAGGRGTAGIAEATLYGGKTWFLRPLLKMRRKALRDFLSGRGISWIDDPTNLDQRYERARLRKALTDEEIVRLNAVAGNAAEKRRTANEAAARLICVAARRAAPGLLEIALPVVQGEDTAVTAYVLRILLAITGGRQHLPNEGRVRAMIPHLDNRNFRASLARTTVTVRGNRLYLHRERRGIKEEPLTDTLVWDGRYKISCLKPHSSLTVVPFGLGDAEDADLAGVDAPAGLVRSALAAEPALWSYGRRLGLAGRRKEVAVQPVIGPWSHLLPSFDLSAAQAAAHLLDAEPVPPPPLHSHDRDTG